MFHYILAYVPQKIQISESAHRYQLSQRLALHNLKKDRVSVLFQRRLLHELDLGIDTIPLSGRESETFHMVGKL